MSDPKRNYILELSEKTDWIPFLKSKSHLPGPRGNLELAYAAMEMANMVMVEKLLATDSPDCLENTPDCFVVMCGVMGLGLLLLSGENGVMTSPEGFC